MMFYAPGHHQGVKKYSKGKFVIESSIILPEGINKGNLYMQVYLANPGKNIYLETKEKIKLTFEGSIMKTGAVFQMDNAGLLYLK